MANRKVLTWPSKKLREKSAVVCDGEDITGLIQDLYDTLNVQNGAGLASPQIGVLKRVIIIRTDLFVNENPDPCPLNDSMMVLINPSIVPHGKDIRWVEGCLSLPGHTAPVVRQENLSVEYTSHDGQKKTLEAKWPLSGAIQHECDHLDGKLFIDRTGRYHSLMIKNKIKKRIRQKENVKSQVKRQTLVDLHGESFVRSMERVKKIRNKNRVKMQKNSRRKNKK